MRSREVAGARDDPAAAQRLLSGFSHGCRNALNALKMSLYLFRREAGGRVPECWDELDRHYLRIEKVFDRLQAIYRPMSLTMVRSPLGPLLRDRAAHWRLWFEARGRTLRLLSPSDDPPGDFDPSRLGVGLDALAEWRAESWEAADRAQVSWNADAKHFEIHWEEFGSKDGAAAGPARSTGAAPAPRPWLGVGARTAAATGPRVGVRTSMEEDELGAEGPDSEGLKPEGSLALPLLGRTISAHGGSMKTDRGPSFRLTVRWPRFSIGADEERSAP